MWKGFKTTTQVDTTAACPFSALIKHSLLDLQENAGEKYTLDCLMKILPFS